MTSRVGRGLALAVAVGLALVSIDTGRAQSQGSGATQGSAAAAANGSGAVIDMEDDEGGGSGSGSALVAPADPAQRGTWLVGQLDAAINARPLLTSRAKIGVAIVDLSTGAELYTHDATTGMSLASNAKLLTSVAALGTLGGGFRWRTAVLVDDKALDETTGIVDGDLYVRGRGDPTLGIADLRALATEVAARGVRQIKGKLVIDDTYFDADVEAPHFADQPKERAAFRAPIASFGVSRSSVIVNVIGEPGGTAKVWLEPDAGDSIKLTKTEVTSVSVGRTRIKIDIKPRKGSKTGELDIEVTGTIRFADGHWYTKKRIDNPTQFAGEVFKAALAEQGVKFTKKAIATGAIPVNAKILTAHDSAPLAQVIREMNKSSDNYYAETVLKTLGAETRATPAPATWADGHAAVQTYLATMGLPPGSYRADNGSGLFDATTVSAKQMVTLLQGAHADYRIGGDLVASLPVGGEDGTLAKRWRNRAGAGRVRAKTGTLEKVATLAGYVAVDSNHVIAFAILVNEIPTGQKGPARAMADDMVDALVAYLDAGSKSAAAPAPSKK
ncbi:MAG TPA: D-alanyl-D-alanine carboxypeptidase/D-alanyl-D-alanine-endopeptidase [Kofleriaceae bacterium]|nr:D-alanyl-D-alanine carboxypeptidase/D-alanyl-D-alanine-endopeptidase [Kofleriaceae bacterium]